MKSNIYVMKLDASFDETLDKFKKQLALGEEIVNVSVSESRLVVTTKTPKSANLLTDELRRSK